MIHTSSSPSSDFNLFLYLVFPAINDYQIVIYRMLLFIIIFCFVVSFCSSFVFFLLFLALFCDIKHFNLYRPATLICRVL